MSCLLSPCPAHVPWLGWPQNGARKSQHIPNPKDKPSPMPSIQISSLGPGLPPWEEGGSSRPGRSLEMGKTAPLPSHFPFRISLDTRRAVHSRTPGGLGLASFIKNRYQHPQRERNSLCTCLWIFFFFPKRKDFGSESSGEIEQHVVPTEPGAVSGCSGRAQNLK